MKPAVLFAYMGHPGSEPIIKAVCDQGYVAVLSDAEILSQCRESGLPVVDLGEFAPQGNLERARLKVVERTGAIRRAMNGADAGDLFSEFEPDDREGFLRSLSGMMLSEIMIIETMASLCRQFDLRLIVQGCDNSHIQRTLVGFGKKTKIPTLQIAHALFNRPLENGAGNIMRLYSDFVAVFGARTRNLFAEYGVDQHRIIETGAYAWDNLIADGKISKHQARVSLGLDPDRPVLLYCASYADGSAAFFGPVTAKLTAINTAVVDSVSRMKQKPQLIVRPHPSELGRSGISADEALNIYEQYRTWMEEACGTEVRILTREKIASIRAADIVIGVNNSSAIAESMILQRPVVKMSFGDLDTANRDENAGLTVIRDYNNLSTVLAQLLGHRKHREALVKKQNQVLPALNYGNDGRATERLAIVVCNLAATGELSDKLSRQQAEKSTDANEREKTIKVSKKTVPESQPRLRILEVVHNFPPYQVGGTELYTLNLAKSLQDLGQDVTVLYPIFDQRFPDFCFRKESYEGLPIIQFNRFGREKTQYSEYDNPEYEAPFSAFLQANPFDVIHFQHIYGLTANWIKIAKATQAKVVLKLDDFFFICKQFHLNTPEGQPCSGPESLDKCHACTVSTNARKTPEAIGNQYAELAHRRQCLAEIFAVPDLIHTPSQFLKNSHEKYGFVNGNLEVIPTGIWPFTIPARPKPDEAQEKLCLAFVGAIDRRKGIQDFLAAVRLFEQADGGESALSFAVYGNHDNDAFYEEIKQKIESLPSVTYHGTFSVDDRHDLFSRIDGLVMPSIGENYPFLLREAHYAGVPVIASEIAGIPEIVKEGVNGRLFPAQDPARLAAIFAEIAKDPAAWSRLRPDAGAVKLITDEAEELLGRFSGINPAKAADSAVQQDKKTPASILVSYSVVVVTYNSGDSINACLKSIAASTSEPHEVLLIDNASADDINDTLTAENRSLPHLQIIKNEVNLGFSKAANQGIAVARGEYIVLLNPDCVLSAGSLDRMRSHFKPRVAAVGPVSNYAAGRQNAWQYMDKNWDDRSLSGLADHFSAAHNGKAIETKLLIGFCMMIDGKVFEKVGVLDEDLFLGNDDLDFSLRLTRAGYHLAVAADTFVYHEGQKSFRTLSDRKRNTLMQESLDQFYAKLESAFGAGQVPSSAELWGVDILGIPSRFLDGLAPVQAVDPGQGWREKRVAVIFDNMVRPDTTGEYCKRALANLCHCDHFLPDQIPDIEAANYDLFVFVDDGLLYDIPIHLRPSAWWVIDTHLQYEVDLEKARRFDFVFAAQKDGAAKLRRDGIKQVHWLPLAADPEIHQKFESDKEYDLCFVGHIGEGPRLDLLRSIQSHIENVFIGQRFFEEMARTFSASKIVFNRSILNDVNMRVFEAAATGSLLLTNALPENGLDELFSNGEEIVTYAGEDDLLKNIDALLEDDERRERIAEQGREKVLAEHTYKHRMQAILETVSHAPTNSQEESEDDLVSIILVTFNGLEMTRRCIASIREHTQNPYELIVVDNGSTDGTLAYLDELTDVQVISNGENLGFAAGNNLGIKQSKGAYILLLNNDTVVTPGWLEGLVRGINLAPEVGLAGPMTNWAFSLSQRIEDPGYDSLVELPKYAEEFSARNHDRFIPTVEKLVGFCLLIKREVIDAIGLLDENFGLGNFEDDDYCLRARLAGFRSVIAGGVFIHHEGCQTFEANGIDYKSMMDKNMVLFQQKWQSEIEFRGDLYYLKQDLQRNAQNEIVLGERAFEAQDLDQALAHFTTALEWDPGASEAMNNMGVLSWHHGHAEEAAQYFIGALRQDANYTEAIDNLLQISAQSQLSEEVLQEIYAICAERESAENQAI